MVHGVHHTVLLEHGGLPHVLLLAVHLIFLPDWDLGLTGLGLGHGDLGLGTGLTICKFSSSNKTYD